MVELVQVQFAIDDPEAADAIVDDLLGDRLVACGQRSGPLVSRYWWQGSLERAEEWLVVLKTRADLRDQVIDAVLDRHPYETPEIVAVAVTGAAPGYRDWVVEVTAAPRP
ncbi:MAG: divalent-cation tolerance protein CutA [Acidimicrobiales bacterium]